MDETRPNPDLDAAFEESVNEFQRAVADFKDLRPNDILDAVFEEPGRAPTPPSAPKPPGSLPTPPAPKPPAEPDTYRVQDDPLPPRPRADTTPTTPTARPVLGDADRILAEIRDHVAHLVKQGEERAKGEGRKREETPRPEREESGGFGRLFDASRGILDRTRIGRAVTGAVDKYRTARHAADQVGRAFRRTPAKPAPPKPGKGAKPTTPPAGGKGKGVPTPPAGGKGKGVPTPPAGGKGKGVPTPPGTPGTPGTPTPKPPATTPVPPSPAGAGAGAAGGSAAGGGGGAAAGAAGAAVAVAAVVAVTVALIEAAKAARDFAYRQEEANRKLAEFSPSQGVIAGQMDARRAMRTQELGESTAGSSKSLTDAIDRFERATLPFEKLTTQVGNLVGAGFMNSLATIADSMNPLIELLNKWFKTDSTEPENFGDWLNNIDKAEGRKWFQRQEAIKRAQAAAAGF